MSVIRPALDLMTLFDAYDTDAECRAYLEDLRWPTGPVCPRCNGKSISRIKERRQFDCDSCRYQFSVTAGTLFHDSHLPLPKWFVAIFLICESKKGMSANQLKRVLKVSYKTAWYLCHRIRAAMTEANPKPLTDRGNRERHTMILAAVERGGAVRMTKGRRKHHMKEELPTFRISEKHLYRYLDEFEFRFNNRKNPYLFRDAITRLANGSSLPYEKLTA
jgi:transposase-like protein